MKRRAGLAAFGTRLLGWLQIVAALVIGVPTGIIYVSYIVGVSFFGGQRDDIGIVRGGYPILVVFSVALGWAGRRLVRGGPMRWWGQLPWLLIIGALILLG